MMRRSKKTIALHCGARVSGAVAYEGSFMFSLSLFSLSLSLSPSLSLSLLSLSLSLSLMLQNDLGLRDANVDGTVAVVQLCIETNASLV
jgi:hypothetical protein